jgi:hypothetical protein
MAEMKHTPGPWVVRHEFNVMARRGKVSEGLVASSGGFSDNTDGGAHHHENVANAHLIAAAPDLLAACKDLLRAYGIQAGCPSRELVDRAHAAISKAQGHANG